MPSTQKPFYGPKNLDLPAEGGLLMVRHAQRPPIVTPEDAFIIDLTDAGCAAARAFGVQLGQLRTIGQVFASPASRCIHTAQEILRGALNGARPYPEVTLLPVLHFDQKLTGIPGLANIYFNLEGFTALAAQPQSAEYALLRETLLASLPIPTEPGVVNLACTHDVNITFLMASLIGLPSASLKDLPGYLEGIYLVRQNGQVRLG